MKNDTHTMTYGALAGAALTLGAVSPASADGGGSVYSVTDLGTIGGDAITTAPGSGGVALNGAGVVVGFSVVADGGDAIHAFRWDGSVTDLGALGDDRQSRAVAINDAGTIVGVSYALGELAPRAVRWEGPTPADLGSFAPRGLSEAGVIVGEAVIVPGGLHAHAVRWDGGVLTDLSTLGGSHSSAYAVNGQGQVVGLSFLAGDLVTRAFLWHDGAMTDLGTLGGANSHALGINDAGEVVGVADRADGKPHAFLFVLDAGGAVVDRIDLGELGGGYSYAYGINEAGTVVGTSDSRAFVHTAGAMHDLNAMIPKESGWQLSSAWAINEQDQITGLGTRNGHPRAFLLCPRDPADVDGDGAVGVKDFLVLLASWGSCTGCPADIDGNGTVDVVDFISLLASWGPTC
jgi:probable HAF family extracellular repeat protein